LSLFDRQDATVTSRAEVACVDHAIDRNCGEEISRQVGTARSGIVMT
jgi:hypothetical protein